MLIAFGIAMSVVGIVANYAFHVGGFWVPDFWLNLTGG
jgi:hypothetical protein